ncbi:MAG TPA: cohesin domain-containing protein [Candidatus Acidoferrum sp.]|nr:cohesin domain-containing protein [Candidatus Acidoferrum sp.]
MKHLTVAFTAFILLITILRTPIFALAQPNTNLYVDPSKYVALAMNETFNININISDAVGVSAWEVFVRFDPTILVVSGYQSGGFLLRAGTVFPLQFLNQSSSGYIQAGETLAVPTEASGNGTLLKLTFKVIGNGHCPLEIYNTLLVDSDLNSLYHTTTDGAFVGLSNFGVDVNGDGDIDTYVNIDTNSSTLTGFTYDIADKHIDFTVGGDDGTIGYANVTIPKAFLNVNAPPGTWTVIFDASSVNFTVTDDVNYTYIYIAYMHSEHRITIIGTNVEPEYPITWLPWLALAVYVTLLFLARRKRLFSKMLKSSVDNQRSRG